MKAYKQATVIEGNLSYFIFDYIEEFRKNGEGFEEFSDEAIIYALLEYSKFPRNYTRKQRIIYVYEKCLEYEGKPHKRVNVETDDYDYFFIVDKKQ